MACVPDAASVLIVNSTIDDLGFSASISSQAKADMSHDGALKKWRNNLITSLFFTIPVFLIMIIKPVYRTDPLHSYVYSAQDSLKKPVIDGLSRMNLVMWSLATGVILFAGRPFFISGST